MRLINMAKRHTKQDSKQLLGQYFTTNVNEMLQGFEHFVQNRHVIDPFAGGWDLLNWAKQHGAADVYGCDISPKNTHTEHRDSLLSVPDYSGKMIVTNPPYLTANKSKGKYKDIYSKWQQNDLYKCFLASMVLNQVEEAIVIIPANFLCESNSKARITVFDHYKILYAKYWQQQVFSDATTGVCALYLRKKDNSEIQFTTQNFQLTFLPSHLNIQCELTKESGYLHGGSAIATLNNTYQFEKVSAETLNINTKIVIGCLDKGKYALGFHINNGPPIKAPKTVITTFQVNTVGFTLSEQDQDAVVKIANLTLQELRTKYHSMFLSNYMGATQKIMSVRIAKIILSDAVYKWSTHAAE